MGNFFNSNGPHVSTPEGMELYKLLREQNATNYDPIKGGLVIDEGNKRFKAGTYVYAEKGGVPGFMIPNQPDTWIQDSSKSAYSKTVQRRHDLLSPPQAKPADSKPKQSQPAASLSDTPPAPAPTNYAGTGGVEYDFSTGRPVGAPENGYSLGSDGKMTAHKPVKPDSSEDTPDTPDTPETLPPVVEDDVEETGDVRTNKNGITQKGMTLGGIKNFMKFNPDLNVANGADFFDFSGVEKAKSRKKMENAYSSTDTPAFPKDLQYELPDSAKPTTPPGIISLPDGNPYKQAPKGWTIPEGSMPGTLGKFTEDPQEGVSPKADIADQTRAIGFNNPKRGERAGNFRNRPGNSAFGGEEPSDSSLVSPMYADKGRNAYRSGFLDSKGKGPMAVLRDASAAQGVIRTNDGKVSIKNGDSYMTYTGDKSAREVAYDLGGGQKGFDKHAADFETLTPPDKPEIKPDDEQTPATIQNLADMDTSTPTWKDNEQGFLEFYKKQVKDGTK